MKHFIIFSLTLLMTGCAISYTSNLSLEFGGYKLVKTEELEELKQQAARNSENVVSETRIGE